MQDVTNPCVVSALTLNNTPSIFTRPIQVSISIRFQRPISQL